MKHKFKFKVGDLIKYIKYRDDSYNCNDSQIIVIVLITGVDNNCYRTYTLFLSCDNRVLPLTDRRSILTKSGEYLYDLI